MLTIADVARAAGVSITTVSRVLSPGAVPHPVRADTAERVRVAARELNFVPSPLARGLSLSAWMTISSGWPGSAGAAGWM